MLKKTMLFLGGLMLAATICLSGGCSSATAPELMTTTKTPGQYGNQLTRIMNNNTRGIWDDLDRMFFLEHNLRLTPYVTP